MELSKVIAHFLPAGIVLQYFLGGILSADLIKRGGFSILGWHMIWGIILGLFSLTLLVLVRRKKMHQAYKTAIITFALLAVTVGLGFVTMTSPFSAKPYLGIFHQVLASILFGATSLTLYTTRRGI
ncbi:MAG: hypothetical protein CMO12_01345 [Thaumarchaeota archaeon]|nr:hypothetical protein [Nitrososphaerota archaeon]|tara:strand:+ start:388 stop:765 length:378 start_codon:yes stop_codon:yes gene_type:complete